MTAMTDLACPNEADRRKALGRQCVRRCSIMWLENGRLRSDGWLLAQVANSSYVWLPLLPREDGLGYTLQDLEEWRPRDFLTQASHCACSPVPCKSATLAVLHQTAGRLSDSIHLSVYVSRLCSSSPGRRIHRLDIVTTCLSLIPLRGYLLRRLPRICSTC